MIFDYFNAKATIILPKEYVIVQGELGREMYVIRIGQVDVINSKGSVVR